MESLIVRHGSRGTRSTLDGLEKSDTGGGPVYHKVKDRLHLLPHRDTAPVVYTLLTTTMETSVLTESSNAAWCILH